MAYSRKTWGAGGSVPKDDTPKRTLYIHHTAAAGASSVDTLAEQRARMRGYDQQHRRQGWDTIGYSFVVFRPHGKLVRARSYVGRDWGGLPAAQLKANSGTIAICVDGNFQTERVDADTLRVLIELARHAKKRGVRRIGGHRDAPGQSTACPGKHLEAVIGKIARGAGLDRV